MTKEKPDWFDNSMQLSPFGKLYNIEFKVSEERTQREIENIDKIILTFPKKPRVLEIAAGSARIGQAISQSEHIDSYVAQDLSLSFLADNKWGNSLRVQSDMRHLPFAGNAFDLALLMYTSFGYFEDKEDDRKVLRETYRVLDSNGRLLLDMPNYKRIISNFRPSRKLTISDSQEIHYEKRIVGDILEEGRTLYGGDGAPTTLLPIRLRIYGVSEIVSECKRAGFNHVTVTDENLQEFSSDLSPRMWVHCVK